MTKMNKVTLYWPLEGSHPLAPVRWLKDTVNNGGLKPLFQCEDRMCSLKSANLLPHSLCLQWTCWACQWCAKCSISTAWNRTSSCWTSPSWSPAWPACTSSWNRATHTWSMSRCVLTCASTGYSMSTTRTCGMLHIHTHTRVYIEIWHTEVVFCCFIGVAPERSGLCRSKQELSHSARLTWKINTDVSNTYMHMYKTYRGFPIDMTQVLYNQRVWWLINTIITNDITGVWYKWSFENHTGV